ncbi:MAG: hypothetical protein Kow0031_27930 [Anaerolineae bacterium]
MSVTLIGLAAYFVLDFPAEATSFSLLGSPLTLAAPQRWLMVLLLGGMAMAGADSIVRAHPALPSHRPGYVALFWMLPGLVVLLATQTLGYLTSAVAWGGSLVLVGMVLWLTLAAEVASLERDGAERLGPRLWRQFVGYTVVLLFIIVIYNTRSRSAVSATAVMLVAGMAALPLLRRGPEQLLNTWLLAGVIGLSLGQVMWALNYWRTGALNAGLLLLLIFYVLIGLSQQYLSGTLSRRTVWEFGTISLVALLVIFYL